MLIIDESHLMRSVVFSELHMLSSKDLDSRSLLTIILAGDHRLVQRLRSSELLAIQSRLRPFLHLEYSPPKRLAEMLDHLLDAAGNSALMTNALKQTLAEHSHGNIRTMMIMADELLHMGVRREVKRLDEKLYFEVYGPKRTDRKPAAKSKSHKR